LDKKFKLGLIGCGLRGTGYISYMRRLKINFELVALADCDKINLENANRDFAGGKAQLYLSGRELVEKADVDAVIIATPNSHHREPAIATIKKGLPFLIEKPIATSLDDLTAMWKAYSDCNGRVSVGFGLRYAPFYREIKKVLESRVLGQVLTINAEELMSDRLSMIFCRSQWRPDTHLTGGLLLEKCCHDIDLINWLSESRAIRVSSFSKRSFLEPLRGPERHCENCSDEPTCRFSRRRTLESFRVNMSETQTENYRLYSQLINNKCPYFHGSPYPDHQSVIIEYENGILSTFNVAQVQPANRRTIHILGSQARLYGVLDDDFFTIYHRTGPNNEKTEIIRVHPDDFGHNGADGELTTDFMNLIKRTPNPSRPGLKEGIESAIMCILADESAATGQSVAVDKYRQAVFNTSKTTAANRSAKAAALISL
jgi:predicted dehydrogenase